MTELVLSLKEVRKDFSQGEEILNVLKGVELGVSEGETIAILGKSGSGKSTLLSLLCGIDDATSGDISYRNNSLKDLNSEEITDLRAKHIGVVFQQFHLLEHLNAYENVLLPLEVNGVSDKSRVDYFLEKVGMSHRKTHFPNQLSGGEKQRIAIARALVTHPGVLLADEPSGSLDENTGDEVMNLIFDIVRDEKMSLILVTHDKDLAKRCEKIYHLENGVLSLEA
ncbi:ABC transporter, ATP-binding protein [Bacteriovorax sp. BAL6_X]|uniref:ABC transporter ATP-binding protein n=1 Tax=Bacteriovorax sp. BAL6_X TaxID=1201290 RepID=UPI00038642EA|nr:ABC transporter ATP-binding protein [Bacteriovorax sp. BAL6_X]EPZ49549.1 ABC transporter, ATP-binding protein [Bacteriovorax sp. BAL6_X]